MLYALKTLARQLCHADLCVFGVVNRVMLGDGCRRRMHSSRPRWPRGSRAWGVRLHPRQGAGRAVEKSSTAGGRSLRGRRRRWYGCERNSRRAIWCAPLITALLISANRPCHVAIWHAKRRRSASARSGAGKEWIADCPLIVAVGRHWKRCGGRWRRARSRNGLRLRPPRLRVCNDWCHLRSVRSVNKINAEEPELYITSKEALRYLKFAYLNVVITQYSDSQCCRRTSASGW